MKRTFFISSFLMLNLFTLYIYALTEPKWLLQYKHSYKNFIVRSDEKIPIEIDLLLDKVSSKLQKSELYNDDQKFKIFICHANWIFTFFTRNKNAGGVVNGILSDNAFIRECDIINDEIIPPGGWLLSRHDRPLHYFIAHELTHSLQSNYNRFMILNTEHYIMEGYADYIAKSDTYDFEHYKNLLINNDNIMDPANGLYNRYHLYIAYLMDQKGYSFKDILEEQPDLEKTLDELKKL